MGLWMLSLLYLLLCFQLLLQRLVECMRILEIVNQNWNKKMVKERRLAEIKQENFLLENKSMIKELERIRAEREVLEADAKDRRWLIKEAIGPKNNWLQSDQP